MSNCSCAACTSASCFSWCACTASWYALWKSCSSEATDSLYNLSNSRLLSPNFPSTWAYSNALSAFPAPWRVAKTCAHCAVFVCSSTAGSSVLSAGAAESAEAATEAAATLFLSTLAGTTVAEDAPAKPPLTFEDFKGGAKRGARLAATSAASRLVPSTTGFTTGFGERGFAWSSVVFVLDPGNFGSKGFAKPAGDGADELPTLPPSCVADGAGVADDAGTVGIKEATPLAFN
mmetsp:Transcript_6446/g.16032  ORF Transcript_6446/g.16032 Transcript_6446/m.16032 type:complete len:233 (+) Transcript_6446:230-928(+)